MATRKTAPAADAPNVTAPAADAPNVTAPAVSFALTDVTELPTTAKGGAGRPRDTAYDQYVTTLHESGKVAKLTGTDDDVKAVVNKMRSAAGFLFEKTVHARKASDGSWRVKIGEPVKRPRKAKADEVS